MGVTQAQVFLPHLFPVGANVDGIIWESYDLPGMEDTFNAVVGFQGYGLTAVLLAYLTQIWIDLKRPLRGLSAQLPISGSGFVAADDLIRGSKIIRASLDLQMPIPVSSDLIYGEVPIYYLGMCGFGASELTSTAFNTGLGLLQVGITNTVPVFGRSYFINQFQTTWVPNKQEGEESLFWWHLKPDLHGILTLYAEDTVQALEVFTPLEGGVKQVFNPLMYSPWSLGDFDGGLNPTHTP